MALLIEKFPLNIWSGEQVYRKGGYLNRNKICIKDGEVIATIDVAKRGFHLLVQGSSIVRPNTQATLSVADTTKLWHRRMGHISYNNLIYIIKVTYGGPNKLEKSLNCPCEICKLAKVSGKALYLPLNDIALKNVYDYWVKPRSKRWGKTNSPNHSDYLFTEPLYRPYTLSPTPSRSYKKTPVIGSDEMTTDKERCARSNSLPVIDPWSALI